MGRRGRLGTVGATLAIGALLLGACGGGASKASAVKGKITVPASNQVVTTTSGPAATAPTTTTLPSDKVESLPVTASVYSALLQAWISWAASNHVAQIMPSDVASPAPGSVFYALDGPTKTYWAIAMFNLSASGQRLLAPGATPDNANALTDGGQRPTFTMKAGSPWTVVDASAGPPCQIPQAVLKVWSFPFDSSVCAAATAPPTTPPPATQARADAVQGCLTFLKALNGTIADQSPILAEAATDVGMASRLNPSWLPLAQAMASFAALPNNFLTPAQLAVASSDTNTISRICGTLGVPVPSS